MKLIAFSYLVISATAFTRVAAEVMTSSSSTSASTSTSASASASASYFHGSGGKCVGHCYFDEVPLSSKCTMAPGEKGRQWDACLCEDPTYMSSMFSCFANCTSTDAQFASSLASSNCASVTPQVDGQVTSVSSSATETSNAAAIGKNALGSDSGMGGLVGVGFALMGMVVGVAFVL